MMAAGKRKFEDEIDVFTKKIERDKEDLEMAVAKKRRVEETIEILTEKIKRNEEDLEVNVAKKRRAQEDIDILTTRIKTTEEDIDINITEKRRFEVEIDALTEKIKKIEENIEVNIEEKQRVEEDINIFTKKIKVEEQDEAEESEEPGPREDIEPQSSEQENLRRNIQLWLERYQVLNPETVRIGIEDLLSLRNVEDKGYEDWYNEVIYLGDVQMNLTYTARYTRNSSDPHEKRDLTAALMQILHPFDKIETRHFPNLREIIEDPVESKTVSDMGLSEAPNLKVVTECLRSVVRRIPRRTSNQEVYLKESQKQLESMMKLFSESNCETYEYLLCAGVLQVFGFKVHRFQFGYHLSKNDFKNMSKMLEDHRKMFCSIEQPCQQQAYMLNLALCCIDQKETAIRYTVDRMAGDLETELQEVCTHTVNGAFDVDKLRGITDKLLTKEQKRLNEQTLVYNIRSQLQELEGYGIMGANEPEASEERNLDQRVLLLLEILEMKKYYPQKLTYEDVIKLRTNDLDYVNKGCTEFRHLPWYFIKHIIGLDSGTRKKCHVEESDGSDSDSSSDDDDNNMNEIHPLDLMYIIFLCSDDFLRQELIEKMIQCQYAVPFLLPSAVKTEDKSKNLVLQWALQKSTKTFYQNSVVVNKPLMNVEAPLITCMSIGQETSWKSKLLNNMLSPQQEAFWHQGMPGGSCKQVVSKGMVEFAWYLPGKNESGLLENPLMFANIRQTTEESETLHNELLTLSSVSCIFVEDVDEELTAFLGKIKNLRKIIILVLHRKGQEKWTKQRCTEVEKSFKLEKHQIVRKVAEDANFSSVDKQLRKSIAQIISCRDANTSLSSMVVKLKDMNGVEIDSEKSYFPRMAANNILRDIDEHNSTQDGSAKATILPFQSDVKIRQQIAALDKELCRQRKLKEDTTVQNYAFDITEEKLKLQVSQLHIPISGTFKNFIRCLRDFNSMNRKYFLQYLKMGLNERSTQQLQPLYEEFEKYRIKDESEERDRRLKEVDDLISHGSLGIEHFFREMAVVYDNITTLGKQSRHLPEFKCVLNILTDIMAAVLKEGTAVEIMDGDAVSVPVEWVTSVLKRIESNADATIFKVSVLGAQSCGKSTLLNTVFGLDFPVSSGRCTRGAYMQLVKVKASLKETLRCDYVAVIDSEGLMSRSRSTDSDYDNELSTFIIGLSDLTLVIIKGEGNEMQDILPLAILVFLRMKIVGEYQSVHFIHQNMGAVDVMTKVATEIEAFVRDLNVKTLAAAKDAGQCDQYKRFTDVLKYNPTEDNTYVPGLWDGALPMGKTNTEYSETMQKLKQNILKKFEEMQKEKKPCSFSEMAQRLCELWNAIKYENFVLSFKNVLAVEAHKKLTKIFDEDRWILKREVQGMLQQEKHIIENEVTRNQPAQATGVNLVENAKFKVQNHVVLRCAEIEKTVLHYFHCSGCDECNTNVTGRHLLAKNEKEFCDEVHSLKKALIKEIDTTMDNLDVKLRIDTRIHQLNTEMDDFLVNKVKETIRSQKSEDLERQDIEELFESLWNDATYDVLTLTWHTYTDPNIEATVQAIVRELLGPDDHFYLQMLTMEGKNTRTSTKTIFNIRSDRHMQLISGYFFKGCITKQDVHRLAQVSTKIINQTRKYYDPTTHPQGKLFNQIEVEELVFEVLQEIHSISDERFRITPEFIVDLVHYIEAQVVAGFTEMHEKYCSHSSPEALLERKKKSYHDLFVVKMGQGNAAYEFCENFLKDLILKNVDEQLSCTELLHDLRVNCGDMFRDIKSIQASIMIDLMRINQFKNYNEYIRDYESCMKKKMDRESKEHFDRKKETRICGQS